MSWDAQNWAVILGALDFNVTRIAGLNFHAPGTRDSLYMAAASYLERRVTLDHLANPPPPSPLSPFLPPPFSIAPHHITFDMPTLTYITVPMPRLLRKLPEPCLGRSLQPSRRTLSRAMSSCSTAFATSCRPVTPRSHSFLVVTRLVRNIL